MQGERFLTLSRVKTIAGVCLLAALLPLHARAQEYSFRNFAGADGLGNLSVQKIYQDRAGFLWVSTENGVFRHDGERFEPIDATRGLPSVAGVAFGEAPDGSLLVGASFGLYHLANHRFHKIDTPFKVVSWTQGIQADAHAHTWLATDTGLFQMTQSQNTFAFKRIYPAEGAPAEDVRGVLLDGEDIWFGCGVKLCKLHKGALTTFDEKNGLLHVPLVAILKDRDGNLWVRARNEGVLEWPKGEAGFRWPDTPVPGRALTGTPALDREGRILLGTPEGLLIHNDQGWQWIDRRAGLRGGVFAAFEDRQHSLWMGTGGRGLMQWRGYREWEGYSSASGLPSDNVFEILPLADGTVWAGTEGGLVHGQPQGFGYTWSVVPGTNGISIHSLQQTSTGDLWFGTAGHGVGVLRAQTNKLSWYGAQEGLPEKIALTIRFDHAGKLWTATAGGLFVTDAPYRNFTRITDVPATWFWTVTETADGTLWAGGVDGLFAYTAQGWQHWTNKDGLSNREIVSLGADRDNSVWVGYHYGGGIDRVRITAQKFNIQKNMQRPGTNGLIYFLRFDRAGKLWAGTERGVDRWDGAHWTHFDTTDGLIWDDCDLGGFASAPDGSLWFGTSGGLSHFTPQASSASAAKPNVLFTELKMGDTSVLGARKPSFAMASGALVVRFAAPEVMQDSSVLFRYRLEGADSAWTETAQRQVEFVRLAPGHYRLEVQVRDRNGEWSPQTAAFEFSIRTPWYGRGWFIGLLALIPFVGALLVFRIRSIAAHKREQRLQQIVDEKTRDLRDANEELMRLTMLDPLTGLANRRHFDQTLLQECARIKRSGSALSLILIDVDHFKLLNDTAGHQKGDEYLIILGQELNRIARRKIDVAARIGGEEFALVLPSTHAAEAACVAEQVRTQVEALRLPHAASTAGPWLTVSIGVATATADQRCSPEELVAAADKALYRAKSGGRNRIEIEGMAQTISSK